MVVTRTSRSRPCQGLIAQRSRAREQRLMMHFLALSPDATAYLRRLEQRRPQRPPARSQDSGAGRDLSRRCGGACHLRRARLPGLQRRVITNILEARARALPEPGPLQLTRRHDLLDIDIAPPDLNAYEVTIMTRLTRSDWTHSCGACTCLTSKVITKPSPPKPPSSSARIWIIWSSWSRARPPCWRIAASSAASGTRASPCSNPR